MMTSFKTIKYTFDSSTTHAEAPKGVTTKHIAKIWKIDPDMVEKTPEVVSQLQKRYGDSSLSRNLSRNDRMLQYKQINC